MGVWCEKRRSWVLEIGRKIIKKTGENKSRSYLIQRNNMAIQRGNAASNLSVLLPDGADLQPVSYL